MQLSSVQGFLPAQTPFDYTHSLAFLAEFAPLRDDMEVTNTSMTRAFLIDGIVYVAKLEAADHDLPGVRYTCWAQQPIQPSQQVVLEDRLSFFLSLSDQLESFYELAADDLAFQPIVQQLFGYHQVKFPSAFENAVWAVLTQRNTAASARTMRAALVSHFGEELAIDGRNWRAFPEAERLAAASVGEITTVIHHAQKGPAVAAVAVAFAQIDERWLRAIEYDKAIAWLLQIHGIGPWGASFVMLRGLGRMERLVIGEKKLLLAIAEQYQRGQPVSEREAKTLAARYGAYQGYWAHYLRVAV